MKKTIGYYSRKQNPEFVKWGVLAKWYGFIGRIFNNWTWRVKSVEYLDKRYEVMMQVIHNH